MTAVCADLCNIVDERSAINFRHHDMHGLLWLNVGAGDADDADDENDDDDVDADDDEV